MKNITLKIFRYLTLFIFLISFVYSCYEDRDDNVDLNSPSTTLEIKDFVWKAMNAVYLYKDNIPDLADDRFSTDEEYTAYLNSFDTPEDLFESLIYMRETVDRFSWITDDYIQLEQQLSGIFKSTGLEYFFYLEPGSNNDVFGIVRLVLHDSPAEAAGIKRGDIITGVNGIELTRDNLSDLFSQDSYTLNFGSYNDNGTDAVDDDFIENASESINLVGTTITENPVYLADIIEVGSKKVGYLVYNGFTNEFDNQLNEAFGYFKSNNIDDLVLDLRYNPGGSVQTASYIGSMVTGQFDGQVFSKLVFNDNLQENNYDYKFTSNLDGSSLNSLGLDKVYIIATGNSASATELVINSLSAYIDVVHVGSNTTGKTQASITVYDSEDLGRDGANPNHTYALQPLVANSVDKNGNGIPGTGLAPDIEVNESPRDFALLGDPNERLLAAALADITGTSRLRSYEDYGTESLESGKINLQDGLGLVIDKLPPFEKLNRLKVKNH